MTRQGDDTGASDLQIAGREAILEAQVALRREHQIALQGRQPSAAVDAQATLGRAHADLIGEHAAEVLDVDGKARRSIRAALGRVLQRVIQNPVCPGQHLQIMGPDLAFNHQPAGQQIELLQIGRREPGRAHMQAALQDIEALQRALVAKQRAPGGERDPAGGIEEAAAVAADAVRVGHHNVRTPSGDFCHALQAGGIARDHFIDDDARRGLPQLRVRRDPAADLGLYCGVAVVEDEALRVDVEVLELIPAHALRAGRRDQYDRHAVGSSVDQWPRAGRRLCIGGERQGRSLRLRLRHRQQAMRGKHDQHQPRDLPPPCRHP